MEKSSNINNENITEATYINLPPEAYIMVFENSADVMLITDNSAHYVEMNEAACKMFGYTKEEFLTKSMNDIFPGTTLDESLRLWESFLSQKEMEGDFEIVTKTGERRITYFRAVTNFVPGYHLFAIRDITEKKNAEIKIKQREEQLRESERKHRQLFETMALGVVYSNTEGISLSANPAALKILGLTESEFIGREIFQPASNFVKEDGSKVAKEDFPVYVALTTGKEVRDVVFGFSPPNNKAIIWVQVNSIPQFNAGENTPKFVYSTIENVSQQKIAQDNIKNSLVEKETLLKEIHHRVKNNLQIISSLLNLQSGYLKDSEAIEILRESQNRVRSMALIHERLYRSDDFTNINFNKFLQDLTNILQSSYYNIAGAVSIELNLEQIYLSIGIAIPLGLLINEIISNSFKHAFVEKKDGKIVIQMLRKENKIFLSIKDNGVGIPVNLNIEESETLGFKLVCSLISQIEADIELKRDNGTEVVISFNLH
jgi:PAS domain S-box-containing protein